MYKIGRISLDEKSLTRTAIMKLSLLNYSIKKITKILKYLECWLGNGHILKILNTGKKSSKFFM